MAVDRIAAVNCSLARWNAAPSKESVTDVFARQALPMVWDYAEGNPFQWGPANLGWSIGWVVGALKGLPANSAGLVEQADAATRDYSGVVISTDPPYYDNIGYSDLSDFFYVWLRRSLRDVHPDIFSTVLVPKAEELVANPYRHGGKDGARDFFEDGFESVFTRARKDATADYPMTVYYAFKQTEASGEGRGSTGWATILGAMIRSGWSITATWPMRSERGGRMTSVGTNALASSIVLVLRPRPEDAPITDRRGLMRELRTALPEAVRTLRSGGIAPVDLAQAAIGPGMSIYSRYSRVVGPDGTDVDVATALVQINAVLDEVLSEQEDDLDPDTRWCLTWFDTHGFAEGPYGDAETLASARNASIDGLRRSGVLTAGGGRVRLIGIGDLPQDYDPRTDDRISAWEVVLHLARALNTTGLDDAARILAGAVERGLEADVLQSLAYRLYSVCDTRGWTEPGILFNALGSSWPEVEAATREAEQSPPAGAQGQLDFDVANAADTTQEN